MLQSEVQMSRSNLLDRNARASTVSPQKGERGGHGLALDPFGVVRCDEGGDSEDSSEEDEVAEATSPTFYKDERAHDVAGDASAMNFVFTPMTFMRPRVEAHGEWSQYCPPSLSNTVCIAFAEEESIFVFGGIADGLPRNDTWIYSIPQKRWSLMDPAVTTVTDKVKQLRLERRINADAYPKPRCGHVAAAFRDMKPPGTWKEAADIVAPSPEAAAALAVPTGTVLNSESRAVLRPHKETPDPEATGDDAVVYRPCVVMFGGANLHDGIYYNDLWLFDMECFAWVELKPLGLAPCARWRATSCAFEGRFFIFGGESSDFTLLNDLHIYDVASNRWRSVRTVEPVPAPRMMHASAVVGDKFVVVGGIGVSPVHDTWILELRTLLWRKVGERSERTPFDEVDTVGAKATSLHGSSATTPAVQPKRSALEGHVALSFDHMVMVHGGKLGGRFNYSIWVLNVITEQWSCVGESPAQLSLTSPQIRWQHCGCMMNQASLTITMSNALSLHDLQNRRMHLTDDHEMKAYLGALSKTIAQQINFEGLLCTHGNSPCLVHVVCCFIFGGSGYPRDFCDLWKVEIRDSQQPHDNKLSSPSGKVQQDASMTPEEGAMAAAEEYHPAPVATLSSSQQPLRTTLKKSSRKLR